MEAVIKSNEEQSISLNYKLKAAYVEITSNCNLKCIHCYNKSGEGKRDYLPLESYQKILEDMVELKAGAVSLSGGEPFLHPNIWDMVELAKSSKLDVSMVSNGTLLTDKIIERLIEYSPTLQVTLEGASEETHDVIRGKGSFNLTLEGLKGLQKSGYKAKKVARVNLNRYNIKELQEIVELSKSLGMNEVDFSWITPGGRAKDNFDDLSISCSEQLKIIEEVNNIRLNTSDIQVNELKISSSCPFYQKTGDVDIGIKVDAKGWVFPCQMFDGKEYSLGNVFKKRLSEIWAEKKMASISNFLQLRASFMNKCTGCVYSKMCQRGCPAMAAVAGNILDTDDFCITRKEMFSKSMKMLAK